MKQEWRLQGKKAKAGFGTPLLWLCLSFPQVLPSDSAWTGACSGWACMDPRLERSQEGREQPESLWQEQRGRRLHTLTLHKSLTPPVL